ncbi:MULTISPECIES: adenosylcobinamide-GDP ribazoletransferase [Pacificibacter]|uniref:adenosylcobinamide-GDP ribazoletransferase n=1 Tax=Pacificibacter TaxID=1042323 RepID=UPI001C09C55A|nr:MULTISPECIES: adenosylcobinamide-GDP ribazoletransferase [Pacificibacter]MBU2935408.1 adenosylcobinamide-GDP ribazoletransferase [Pacificibacter marinus]MDO6615562.1 adenosylcobinamide-GDP ribazoletransferase [Pacificibacter sp. 1_MG-2023]
MTPTAFRLQISDIKTAFALLTRLPVKASFERTAEATWAFPIVGVCLGVFVVMIALLSDWIGLSLGVSAGLAIASAVIITGAMHEDGIADSADGLWGGWAPARRLEIMRDSHIGSYGVLALILVMLLRFSAITMVINNFQMGVLVAAAVLSRAAMPFVMTLLPHARDDGLSVQTGRPNGTTAAFGAVIALGLAWLSIGFVPMVFAASACGLIIFGVMKIAKAKIGGQTGDILGATQVLCELCVLAIGTTLY